ncbi:MAG: ArsA family ATPase [Candidatus Dormibacteria bacterium]
MSAAAAGTDLVERLRRQRVIVCCGSGGVGKTTVSAALGMALVAARPVRVMVLTVDPARRLATALGLRQVGTEPTVVEPALLRRAGIEPKGELVCAMLDMKTTWDRMIERYAPNREARQRILASPFYRGISEAFIGSHDYMAMEALYELHTGGEYDVLVIDTPPSRNALDFLEAPNHLVDFVGGRLLSWLARPSRLGWRAFNVAAAPFLRMADRLLGADVLAELGTFVADVQGMYGGVQKRAQAVYELLRSAQSGFVVVTTLEPAAFGEGEFFARTLRDYSMPLRGVVVNRILPEVLRDHDARDLAHRLIDDPEAVRRWSRELGGGLSSAAARTMGEGHLALEERAARDAAQLGRLEKLAGAGAVRVPLAESDVADLTGLAEIARRLLGEEPVA